jgi:hypothetical protein
MIPTVARLGYPAAAAGDATAPVWSATGCLVRNGAGFVRGVQRRGFTRKLCACESGRGHDLVTSRAGRIGPLVRVGYVAGAIAIPHCVSVHLPPKVKMTRTEIRPAFDPTLHPIGYALASELLAEGLAIEVHPALAVPVTLSAPSDLFGWEWEHVAA